MLSTILNWAGQHYILAWCALWLVWGVFGTINLVFFKLPNRVLRTIRVCFRGWPPEHLDADGDWKPEPKKE